MASIPREGNIFPLATQKWRPGDVLSRISVLGVEPMQLDMRPLSAAVDDLYRTWSRWAFFALYVLFS